MHRRLTFSPICAVAAGLLGITGCQEGAYQYDYHGTVLRSDGITPAEGVRLIPHPSRREGIFGARFNLDDPDAVVSGVDGRFNGTMHGWFAMPLLWPSPPQECKADKVWVYLPEDNKGKRWRAVVVPVRVEKRDQACTGTIENLTVVLPEWYAD